MVRYVSMILGLVSIIYFTIALDSFWEFNGVSLEIAEILSMMSAVPLVGLIFYLEGFFADNERHSL